MHPNEYVYQGELRTVINKCRNMDPAKRYKNVEALLKALSTSKEKPDEEKKNFNRDLERIEQKRKILMGKQYSEDDKVKYYAQLRSVRQSNMQIALNMQIQVLKRQLFMAII